MRLDDSTLTLEQFMTSPLFGQGMEALSRIPGKKPRPIDPFNPEVTKCACGFYKPVTLFNIRRSRFATFRDTVCPECVRFFRPYAKIVCAGCGAIVQFRSPEKEKSGFVWEAGGVYHVAVCGFCNPETKKAPVIEALAFYRINNLPYEP